MTHRHPHERPAARLLLTGFEPFGTYTRNPSGELAAALDGHRVSHWEIAGRILPVSWTRAWPTLHEAARALKPAALLMTGVAPTPHLRLEVMALNVTQGRRDSDNASGPIGPRLTLIPEAPPAYWTALPVDALAERLNPEFETLWPDTPEGALQPRIRRSPNAGNYLCNQVFFMAMHQLRDIPTRGFVHLPPLPGTRGRRGLPADRLEAAFSRLIEALAQAASDAC